MDVRHGDVGRPAVHYLYKSLPFEELVAFYRAADVMLVTPLRDGMNLVAKEYVAARDDGHGVLVLSELAGAAQELREALLVNPHDVDGLASAMERALAASDDEQRERMQAMRATVRAHDVYDWALDFLDGLQHAPRAAAPAPRRGVALRALRDPDVPVDALGTRLLRRTRSDSTGTRA